MWSRLRRVFALGQAHRGHALDERIASHVVALDALGWHIVELRPSLIDGEVSIWYVTAERVDQDASLRVTAADPAGALAELVRYASADSPTGSA